MVPPVWEVLSTTPALQALIGTAIYPGGQAPDGTPMPYVTWQGISGLPENYLGQRPDIDQFGVQFNCWAATVAEARAVAAEVRDAVEPLAHVVSWRGDERDDATGAYGYSFDVDWFTHR